jgi:hypothetical protein
MKRKMPRNFEHFQENKNLSSFGMSHCSKLVGTKIWVGTWGNPYFQKKPYSLQKLLDIWTFSKYSENVTFEIHP